MWFQICWTKQFSITVSQFSLEYIYSVNILIKDEYFWGGYTGNFLGYILLSDRLDHSMVMDVIFVEIYEMMAVLEPSRTLPGWTSQSRWEFYWN